MARLALFCGGLGRLRERKRQPETRDAPSVTPPAAPGPVPIKLETLPAELRHLIIESVEDLQDLKSLVLASPVYHEQYLHSRRWFLRRILQTTLGDGNVLADAYANHASRLLHKNGPESYTNHATFYLFMAQYVAHRSVAPGQLWVQITATEDDLVEMAAFYLGVVRPLLDPCAAIFLSHLDSSIRVGFLSRTERTRLLRALYRFQIYCYLFGMGPSGNTTPFDAPREDRLNGFFCRFPPWEIEEIDCIYMLIRDKYESLFDTIKSDVAKEHPRFQGSDRPWAPMGSFDLESPYYRRNFREGTASRGLQPFLQVLQATDHETLVTTMQKHIVSYTTFIEESMTWGAQERRREQYPSDEDAAQTRRDRMLFLGDRDPGAPPLAWVMMWRGQYCNEFGRAVNGRFKQWGFVFWDCKRLNASGRKERLVRHLPNSYMRRPMRWSGLA